MTYGPLSCVFLTNYMSNELGSKCSCHFFALVATKQEIAQVISFEKVKSLAKNKKHTKYGIMHCREATGMVMHKDSRWYQSWQNFKDNNHYVTSKSSFNYSNQCQWY